MANDREKREKVLNLVELVQAELKKATPLLQIMAEMVGNESTMNDMTLGQIDESIDTLQTLDEYCRVNPSEIDSSLADAVAEFAEATITFYEGMKELHYIHGTRMGADKRKDATEHIEDELRPALARHKEAKNRLTAAMNEYESSL